MTDTPTQTDKLLAPLDGLLPELESAYKDIHAHPELSMQEHRLRNWQPIIFGPPDTK